MGQIADVIERIESRFRPYDACLIGDLNLMVTQHGDGVVLEALRRIALNPASAKEASFDQRAHAREVRQAIARVLAERRQAVLSLYPQRGWR